MSRCNDNQGIFDFYNVFITSSFVLQWLFFLSAVLNKYHWHYKQLTASPFLVYLGSTPKFSLSSRHKPVKSSSVHDWSFIPIPVVMRLNTANLPGSKSTLPLDESLKRVIDIVTAKHNINLNINNPKQNKDLHQ